MSETTVPKSGQSMPRPGKFEPPAKAKPAVKPSRKSRKVKLVQTVFDCMSEPGRGGDDGAYGKGKA